MKIVYTLLVSLLISIPNCIKVQSIDISLDFLVV